MWLDGLTLDTVIVHTINDGPSYKGNKRLVHADGIGLTDAVRLSEEGPSDLIDGLFFVPREQVASMQILGWVP